MSQVTKRKHVMNETLRDDYELPKENQFIVKLIKNKGNNLHEICTASGEEYLVSMPTKFRKNIWVKRGDFLLVEPIPEGDKVKAEIVKIMKKDSIKYFKENNVWPKQFEEEQEPKNVYDIFENTNRKMMNETYDSDSMDSESSDSDSSDSSNHSGIKPSK